MRDQAGEPGHRMDVRQEETFAQVDRYVEYPRYAAQRTTPQMAPWINGVPGMNYAAYVA